MFKPGVVILAAALLLSPAIVAEVGMQALVRAGRLPEAPSSNAYADVSIANLARAGRPDVLVIGTSSIRNALVPDVLEELVERDTGDEIRVHGVAIGGLSHNDQRVLVEGLAKHDLLPQTVIVGLTPSSVRGTGEKQDWFATSELGRTWSDCADVAVPERISCQLPQRSTLWRWRGHLDRLLTALTEPMTRTFEERGQRLLENGWYNGPPSSAKRLDGTLAATLEQLPEGVEQDPLMLSDFAALVDELRAHGTTVIPVAVPYSPPLIDALLERNPEWRDGLESGYASLTAAADVEIVEISEYGEAWEPQWQRDHRHLSRKGARIVTEQLWEMPKFREALLEGLASGD